MSFGEVPRIHCRAVIVIMIGDPTKHVKHHGFIAFLEAAQKEFRDLKYPAAARRLVERKVPYARI